MIFHNAQYTRILAILHEIQHVPTRWKRIKTILLATAVAITACNRARRSEFGMLPIDTLLGTQDNGCNAKNHRFATIGNAGKSAAWRAIEKRISNISSSWRSSPVRHAADSAILQVAADIVLPEGGCHRAWAPTKSPSKAKAPYRTRSLPTRSPGGVSRAGRTACGIE